MLLFAPSATSPSALSVRRQSFFRAERDIVCFFAVIEVTLDPFAFSAESATLSLLS